MSLFRKLLIPTLVVIPLLCAEIILRVAETRLSGNVAHIKAIPALAETLGSKQGAKVLLLGNSLTNNGFDPDLLRDRLKEQGHNVSVEKITPDATAIWDWLFLYDNVIGHHLSEPVTVVVGFAWNIVSDQARESLTRLGAFYANFGNLYEFGRARGLTVDEFSEFTLAKVSRLFAHRERIRNSILSYIIPDYQSFAQESDPRQAAQVRIDDQSPGADVSSTYEALYRLSELVNAKGGTLVLVAMPVIDPYEIAQGMDTTAEEGRITLLDFRVLSGLTRADFEDNMHLGASGREKATKYLGEALAPKIHEASMRDALQ